MEIQSVQHKQFIRQASYTRKEKRTFTALIRYSFVTLERENNEIQIQVQFTAFTSLMAKIVSTFRNMILSQIVPRKVIPRNDGLFSVVKP